MRRAVKSAQEAYPAHAVPIEDKGSGQQLLQEFKSDRIPAVAIMPIADKEARARAITATIEAGKVYLPEGAEWVSDFLEETAAFPNAAHDDQVDSMAQALTYMRQPASTADIRVF